MKKVEKKVVIKNDTVVPSKKKIKVYTLGQGDFSKVTEGNKVLVENNPHSKVIGEAILTLIKQGKTKATREEIMVVAEDGGLYDKASKSSPSYIFSWWLGRNLKPLGFILG